MKKLFLSLILFVFMCISISCDDDNQIITTYIKTQYQYYHKICLDNVMYWTGNDKLAPVFNIDGSLEICNEEIKEENNNGF